MAQTRDIKRRIKSVSNTKKVTKAMEMVAAAKMRKAVANVLASRSYASLAWELVKNLAAKTDSKYHPLLHQKTKVSKIALVLVTSNRGLCGGFNTQIINRTLEYIKKDNAGGIDLVVLGKKGANFMAKRGIRIVAEFDKLDVTTQVTAVRPMARLLVEDFVAEKYDKVVLAYSDFISTLMQKPRILELLPITKKQADEDLGAISSPATSRQTQESPADYEYLFEPSPDKVLNELLPRLIEMQIYQAILESDASEHSSRMVAMRNATDAAAEMIDELTLAFNKARQASITSELADISGGRLAME